MSKVQKKGTRVQVVLNDELKHKLDRIMITNRFESYPQALRFIIKYFNEDESLSVFTHFQSKPLNKNKEE